MTLFKFGLLTVMLSTSVFARTPIPEYYKMDCKVVISKTSLDQELFDVVYKKGFNKKQTIYVTKRHYNGNSSSYEDITQMYFQTNLEDDSPGDSKVMVRLMGVADREIGGMQIVGGFSSSVIQSGTLTECKNYNPLD